MPFSPPDDVRLWFGPAPRLLRGPDRGRTPRGRAGSRAIPRASRRRAAWKRCLKPLLAAVLLGLGACAEGGPATGAVENRCLKRIQMEWGYQGRWVRCPPGSPVVLPDDY
jgi:hypothetical protein